MVQPVDLGRNGSGGANARGGTALIRAALVVLIAAPVYAQTPRHVTGFVSDTQGKPVAGAAVVFTGVLPNPLTDMEGRFEVDTAAPAIVIRQSGFRSEFVRLDALNVPRITIQKLRETLVFPACDGIGRRMGINYSFYALFRFRSVRGLRAAPQEAVEGLYARRLYSLKTPHGEAVITHTAGPKWSFGDPPAQDVWRLHVYDETVYTTEAHFTVVDAHGELENGNRWRFLGTANETASYSDVDESTAKLLDRFLDSACLASIRR